MAGGTAPSQEVESKWYIFWFQSMAGRDNAIPYNANKLTNWWTFTGDWDAAITGGLGLHEPSGCSYGLSASSQSATSGGGAFTVNVTGGSGCKWIASSNEPWLAVTSGRTGNGNGAVAFSVAANAGGNARSGTIAVAGQVFTVTQTGSSCPAITLSPATPQNGAVGAPYNQAITASGGVAPYGFALASGALPAGVSLSSSGALTGTPSATGTSNFTVRATDANACFSDTAYSLFIAPACSFALNPTSANLPAAGGGSMVNVTTQVGCGWTATSNAAWITINSGASGSGSGPVAYTVAANTGFTPRTGTLTIAGQTFTVTQAAACLYRLPLASQVFTSGGGSGSISVLTTSVCAWTASSNTAWINVTGGASGSGDGTVNYSVAANAGLTQRSGTLTVAGQTFTIFEAGTAPAATITVTSTADTVANDGVCTLREAILNANGNNQSGSTDCAAGTNTDTIAFNIPGAGPHTIAPTSSLPNITDPVIIDGTTQPGASCTTAGGLKIELSGANAGGSVGVPLIAGNSLVRGLVINRFGADGIANPINGNNTISCNYIGTNVAGTADLGNSGQGINLNSPNNLIGGTTLGEGNLLSGNDFSGVLINNSTAIGNRVEGNLIGTDITGTLALGNGTPPPFPGFSNGNGVAIGSATNNIVGGLTAGARNIISGNLGNGIQIDRDSTAFGNRIEGNYIGTDITGTADLGNTVHGVILSGVFNNIVGGTTVAARNVISGNNGNGVNVVNSGTSLPTGNRIEGNYIGTTAAGTTGIGNGVSGITLSQAQNTKIGGLVGTGAGNLIAFNGSSALATHGGIIIFSQPIPTVALGNSILSNTIHSNTGLGIDLGANGVTANDAGDVDTGANNLQNFPMLTQAFVNGGNTNIVGTLNSAPNTTYTIDFFSGPTCDASGNGEGRFYRGQRTVTTDASGNAAINDGVVGVTNVGDVITATATDPAGNTSEFSACRPVTASCPAIIISPVNATLPTGSAGLAYNQTFTAAGGAGGYSFSLTAGALPGNTSLSAGGLLSGAPTTFGDFTFTITATDANGCGGSRQYSLHINQPCNGVPISPATLANGFVGVAYSQMLSATGSTAPYTFTVLSGGLPTSVTLNSSSGLLSGNPSASGTFNFTIQATDSGGCTGARAYTVIISGNGLVFYPLPRPVRILDTRASQGNCDNVSTPIAGGTSLTTLARLTCEGITIPSTAQAITGNLTALNNTSQIGFLTIYPDGQPLPLASNMIYAPNVILSNNFTVGLSSDGKFNVFGERTIDVVVDISGYYAPPGAGGLYYHPLSKPIRLLDTRAGLGNCDNVGAPIPGGASITTLARTTCETLTIPQAAQAIVGNATVINGSGQVGYLTIYPNGVAPPLAANMVYFPGQILSNAFTVSLSADGEFNVFGERTIDVVIDVAGYYSNEATDANGPGLLFTPLARPLRTLDTRAGQGNCDVVSTPIIGGNSIATPGRLTCEGLTIPSTAQSILGNVTVINQTGTVGYLTLYPDGVSQPLVATMIYFPNQILSNAFVAGVNSSTGQFRIFAERTLDAVVDVSGYFAP